MKQTDKKQFFDCLDFLFLSQGPAIPGKGEDNFCCLYREDAAVVSVFDGCGGLGGRQYPGFRGHTGAYVASRLASGAMHDWFDRHHGTHWENGDALRESLDTRLRKNLLLGPWLGKNEKKFRGAMVRDFPTTAAIALAQPEGDHIVLHILWAGDSRVYLLDEKGLAQMSADDSENQDALDNLTNDGELTNLLAADDRRHELHYKRHVITGPTLVFTATDGTFGYIPSPMEFEYTVTRLLLASDSINTFKQALTRSFNATAGDDFAFGCMGFYCGPMEQIHALVRPRVRLLEQDYIPVLQRDRSADRRLWAQYRGNYERYL